MSLLLRLCALITLGASAFAASAVDERDLLPVDQAFALSARADSRERIDLHWAIADGYYLYRHRTRVVAADGFAAGTLQLPPGKAHVDEFFGPVETYRGQLSAQLPGRAGNDSNRVSLEVHYQGCADIGVCYPPQKRTISVVLPSASAPAANGAGLFNLPGLGGNPGNAAGLRLPGTDNGPGLPLPAEQAYRLEAVADGGNTLLLRFTPAPGYYLYRDRSAFSLEGLDGVRTGTAQWPAGKQHHDEYFGHTVVYFDPVEVRLPLRRQAAGGGSATLVATFQGCQDQGICYPPLTRRIRVEIPRGTLETPAQAQAAQAAATRPALPPATVVSPQQEPLPGRESVADSILPAPPGSLMVRPRSTTQAETGDASADNALRSTPPGQSSGSTLWLALLLALAGGLLLNLMPCVLPVLSLKALGLAQSGESRAHARGHALWYTAGVLTAFTAIGALVLALRTAGQAAGWGFQLQQPVFVAGLVYLMFAMGLSLSGVFSVGRGSIGPFSRLLGQRSGPAGDFLTGVLACVMASPCIAPFMGGALAYAFAAPPLLSLLVFAMLGLGLALPFLLIGFVPALADRLPRPGAWMETFKQLMAFPMYVTAIWLLWVLGKQRGVDGMALLLAGLALLALALWWAERSLWRERRGTAAVALLLAAVALSPAWLVGRLPPPAAVAATTGNRHVAYDPGLLDRLRADNRVVFVNMTADWCVTCKANERNVIEREAFADVLRRTGAVYMRGDWTNVDPAISAFLAEHKAVGVPLYVVYGPGAPPRVLPTVLTQSMVEDALLRAAR
ncbi:cytochrome C biogenesis protein [Stenotrophomonas koreensis]|uniref:Cytochrome C biogenesis protein n=1 Tax=Stenotrophomonas koreensis TaxID=266128 RepID=A0A0R0BTQ5_9GAMM|nr:protein-disulfide reductase DsbD [Stenotrophomonas koreensis]KRG57111.1 cytochrome C biogenesis protein [Stenotrophomonas koreensis]